MRDLDENPYTKDEQRVVAWLVGRSPEIGGGDDPIGFLLASYEYVHAELVRLRDDDSLQTRDATAG